MGPVKLQTAKSDAWFNLHKYNGWFMEPKLDGFRAGVIKERDTVQIYSRTHKPQEDKVPHLVEALEGVDRDFHLDGEIGLLDDIIPVGNSVSPLINFNDTAVIMGSGFEKAIAKQGIMGEVTLLIFDILELQGSDLRRYPDAQRRVALEELLNHINSPFIQPVPRWSNWNTGFYRDIVDQGGEGVMMKKPNGLYLGTRSSGWVKMKKQETADVVIMGFTDGQGKYEGLIGAVKFGQWITRPGRIPQLIERGKCSGMTDRIREWLTEQRDNMLDGSHHNTPIVMEIKHNGKATDHTDGFRHPQFLRFRTDKVSADCYWD